MEGDFHRHGGVVPHVRDGVAHRHRVAHADIELLHDAAGSGVGVHALLSGAVTQLRLRYAQLGLLHRVLSILCVKTVEQSALLYPVALLKGSLHDLPVDQGGDLVGVDGREVPVLDTEILRSCRWAVSGR